VTCVAEPWDLSEISLYTKSSLKMTYYRGHLDASGANTQNDLEVLLAVVKACRPSTIEISGKSGKTAFRKSKKKSRKKKK
jgi:hypothetical protein